MVVYVGMPVDEVGYGFQVAVGAAGGYALG